MTPARLLSLLAAATVASAAPAALTPVGPFVGDHTETWESFDNYTLGPDSINLLPDPTDIMGGFASISGELVVYELGSAATFGFGRNGTAQVADGIKSAGQSDRNLTTTITFDAPIRAFGAYWGAVEGSTDSDVITLTFSDGSTAIFDYEPIPAASGALMWQGWTSNAPITSLTFSGDFVAADGLQATEVPEPTSVALVLAAATPLLATVGRKRPAA